MQDPSVLLRLYAGDHEFIPGVAEIEIAGVPYPEVPDKERYIEKRWEDYVAGRKARGLETGNGRIMLTHPGSWKRDRSTLYGTYRIGAFPGEFRELATTRPAFGRSAGRRAGPLKGHDFYGVGTGGLAFVWDSLGHLGDRRKYLLLGLRDETETGGRIDTLPSAFLTPHYMGLSPPAFHGFIGECEKEVARPWNATIRRSGVMKSDYWRNLTACFECTILSCDIESDFIVRERRSGDKVEDFQEQWVLKRRKPLHEKGKYEEIFMVSLESLKDYVFENIERYGHKGFSERAGLFIGRYLGLP